MRRTLRIVLLIVAPACLAACSEEPDEPPPAPAPPPGAGLESPKMRNLQRNQAMPIKESR